MKTPLALPLDEAAYKAGFVSGNLQRDEPYPYPLSSRAAWSWSSGRIEGAAKPRGTVPQLRPLKQPPAMKYGYARVSTNDQNSALQLAALKKAGCRQTFTDEGISGRQQSALPSPAASRPCSLATPLQFGSLTG